MKNNFISLANFVTFPLYVIFVIFYLKEFDYVWLINIFVVYILYTTIWWTGSHFLSSFQIKDFYNEFISKKRLFDVYPIEKSKIEIDNENEFSWLIYNHLRRLKLSPRNPQYRSILDFPILLFYADPIENKVLSSSKAYLYGQGVFIVVCRTKDINKNAYEKFLFYHELEHINDNGLFQFRTLCKYRLRFIIHAIIFLPIILGTWQTSLYVIFITICGINVYLNPIAHRECIADYRGLLKMTTLKDRIRVLHLLEKTFKGVLESSTESIWKKRIFAQRLALLSFSKEEISADIPKEEMKLMNYMLPPEATFYTENNFETTITTIILLIFVSFLYVPPVLILKILMVCIVIYLFLLILAIFVSNLYNLKVYRNIFSKFKIEDFYQPFELTEEIINMSPKDFLKRNFNQY